MDHNENTQPTLEQINTAKDAITLARLVLAGQQEAGADMILSLLNDPRSIPGVLNGLCGLIAHALPQDVDPEVFFQSAYAMLDGLSDSGPSC